MTVGIDISQIIYPGTGVGMYTRELVTALLARNDPNVHYVLYGANLREQKQLLDFAKGKNVKTAFWKIPPTLGTLLHNKVHILPIESFTGDLDLFHTSDWIQPRTNCPKIMTIHDLVVYKAPESSHPKIIATQKQLLSVAIKECVHFIVDSEATKKDCEEILGIDPGKMTVIPLAAGHQVDGFTSLSEGEKKAEIARVKDKYKLSGKYFFTVGTRQPRKNIGRLIEAVALLGDKDVRLAIGGNFGWGGGQVQSSQVSLLGFVPEEDIAPLFAGSEAFVYPSLYEGFGISILEAMAAGTIVVTSNLSSMPEAGGKAALYVDPYSVDSIKSQLGEVLNLSAAKRNEKIKQGLLQAKKFSWDKTAAETFEVYKRFAR